MRRWPSLAAFLLTLAFTLSAHAHPLTSASAPETAPRGVKIQIGEIALADVSNCLQLKGKSASSRTIASGELFTGEQFDPNVGFYYLRARYYNPTNGRFPTMDTWMGNPAYPVSLHKYLYASGSPVDFVDPTGLYTAYTPDFGREVEREVCNQYRADFPHALEGIFECGKRQHVGKSVTRGGFLKPDLFDFKRQKFAEIKPFSLSGIVSGKVRIKLYEEAFGVLNLWINAPFTREQVWAPDPAVVDGTDVWFFNSEGVIFYTDEERAAREAAAVGYVLSRMAGVARRTLFKLATRVGVSASVTAGANIAGAAAATQGRAIASMRPITYRF